MQPSICLIAKKKKSSITICLPTAVPCCLRRFKKRKKVFFFFFYMLSVPHKLHSHGVLRNLITFSDKSVYFNFQTLTFAYINLWR